MKFAFTALCVVALTVSIGCGTPESSNILENADEDALAEYDKLAAESANMITEEDVEGK